MTTRYYYISIGMKEIIKAIGGFPYPTNIYFIEIDRIFKCFSRAQHLVSEADSLGRSKEEIEVAKELKIKAIHLIFPVYENLNLRFSVLSDLIGKSAGWFTMWFKASGVRAKSNLPRFPRHPTTYHCDELVFDDWNPEMAYWLGFIWADGNVRDSSGRYGLRLTVKIFDRTHLVSFQSFMKTNVPIKIVNYRSKRGGKYYPQAVICINRKRVVKSLEKYNISAHRSVNGEVFPEIPNVYIWDFFRGFFDGDGAIHRPQVCKFFCSGWAVGFFGSKTCMEFLRDLIFKDTGITMKVRRNGKSEVNYSLTRTGPAVLPVLKLLYPEKMIVGLPRKVIPARLLCAFYETASSYGVAISQRGDGMRFVNTEKLPADLGELMSNVLAGDLDTLHRFQFS